MNRAEYERNQRIIEQRRIERERESNEALEAFAAASAGEGLGVLLVVGLIIYILPYLLGIALAVGAVYAIVTLAKEIIKERKNKKAKNQT